MVSNEQWAAYRDQLRHFIQRRIADPQAAEDVLQTVLLKAIEQLDTLQNTERLRAWLYQIARNSIADYHRCRRSMPLPENIPIEAGADDASSLGCDLLHAVDNLPSKYQQALLLYEIEGVPQKEIAERLDLSVSGAKSRVQRARQMLRDVVLDCCDVVRDRRGGPIEFVPRSPGNCQCGVH